MDTKRICSICGKPLAPNAPEGLCPECLLKGGLGTGVDIGPDTGGKAPRFTPPKIEELAAKFPQLEILEFIGQGGMGAVYKARQKQLDRVVALKILPPQAGGPAFAERFTREARALAKLNHPHIVTLYEFGQSDGLFYFLMEFVDGVNLRQLLSNSRISPREALGIVPQICEALQFAHDSGIVHRDIKPENILLDKKGQVKIADFGVAKMIAESLTEAAKKSAPAPGELTEAGSTLGTPQYMAPEQIKNPAEVDHRADIYSLGVVFYQMLTGELPSGKIEPPSSRMRGIQIDVRLDEVVLRALEKKPELRFQQASDVKTIVETIATTPQPTSSETPPGFKHYKDPKWNFELDIPEGWKTLPPNHKNSPLEVLRFAANTGRHLLIIFRTPSYYVSPKDASEWAQKQLAKAGFGNFVPAETTIGDKPALMLDFDRPEDDGTWSWTWSCRHYFIAEARNTSQEFPTFATPGMLGYTLGFGTTDKAGMFEILDRIAKSFRFQPSGDKNPFKPYFPKTQNVAADEPKPESTSQKAEPELHTEGYTVRIEPVNPSKPARRFGMGAVITFLAILMAAVAILLIVHKAPVNARMRATSHANVLFHYRVFEADAGLVDQLIPTSERRDGVQPNVQSLFAQGVREINNYSQGAFHMTVHGAETESQIAQVSPAVVHSLLQEIAATPGVLVDRTNLVPGIWWQPPSPTAGLPVTWNYSVAKNSHFGNGSGSAFLGVRKNSGNTELRIDGELQHSIDVLLPGEHSYPVNGNNSRFLYEGPLPQTNELVFLMPFVRHDGSQHYLVTVFDFNGESEQETPNLALKGPPFTAQLHQATVELAAVGNEPWTNPVCWNPNGQASPKTFPTGHQSDSIPDFGLGMIGKKLVFYVRNRSANDVSAPICHVDESWPLNITSTWAPPYEFDHKGYFGLSLGVPTNATMANLSIGVANGPWETVVSMDRTPTAINGQGIGEDDWRGTYESVTGSKGDVAVGCSYTTRSNWVSRIVYVNGNGNIVPVSEKSNPGGFSDPATGTLLISSNEYAHIKRFLVQRRKFQWVDFDNISLQQGHLTSVTAKVY